MAVAATIAAMMQQEEENFTPSGGDWSQYEFKILRAILFSKQFSDPIRLQQVLAEEAVAGWELHEKLDELRLRLRRKVSCRAKDALLAQDPYRTFINDPPVRRRYWLTIGLIFAGCFLLSVIIVALTMPR